MIQSILALIQEAERRGTRSVILVPHDAYREALLSLSCAYPENTGRSVRMFTGEILSVLPSSTTDAAPENFDLYLSGWGRAKMTEETTLKEWIGKARGVYTDASHFS